MIVFHKNLNILTSSLQPAVNISTLKAAGDLQIVYIIILQHYQAEIICSEIEVLVTDRDKIHESHDDIDSADSLPFVFRNGSLTR